MTRSTNSPPRSRWTPVHPDLLAFARQTLDLEAFEAEIEVMLAGGGHTFEEVMAAVEAAVRGEAVS